MVANHLRGRFSSIESHPNPGCCRFFHQSPEGKETGFHESLPSYLERLARLHGVPNGPFFSNEIHPKPVPSTGSLLAPHSRGLLVGSGYAEAIARSLAANTGEPAVVTLVQPELSRHLAWYKDTRPLTAWCPICLADQLKGGLPVYRPLLWALKPVLTCPKHNVFLEEHCPNCSRSYYHFAPTPWFPYCVSCGCSLALKAGTRMDQRVPSHFEAFSASAILELLHWGLNPPGGVLSPNCFAENIEAALQSVGGEYVMGQLASLSRPVVQKWRHGRQRPTLNRLANPKAPLTILD